LPNLVDEIIGGKTRLGENDVWEVTGALQDRYRAEKNVVRTDHSRFIFVGDLHGEFEHAKNVQRLLDKYQEYQFVFLGDYGDRGPHQLETFHLVAALAIRYTDRVLMLRGNHEASSVAARYGFYHEVVKAYSHDAFMHYARAFSALPMALHTGTRVFACHGGVPEGVESIADIDAVNRHSEELDSEVLFQMAWNDPREGDFEFGPNSRGGNSKIFGEKAFNRFCEKLGIDLMVRAHEVIPEGARTFFGGRLFSIFSASYGGRAQPKVLRVGPALETEILGI
jgi:diadenosine tetraphosphatase ApaH/serine/threonine PP2A family protein phosphatase